MSQNRYRPARRKTQRRWRVPPALTHGDDVFEGLSVLGEVSGEAGLMLWQSLRDALLWGEASPAARGALFAPEAETRRMAALLAAALDAEVETPLAALAHVVGNPGAVTEEEVAQACRRIAKWAEGEGLPACALAFAQAAALVTPHDPVAAYQVARLARHRAEHARAESWYRRAVALARQAGDWRTYTQSFLGMGNLYVQRGNFPAATRMLVRALKASDRNSLHELRGAAFHDLFGIAIETGDGRSAERYARSAYEAYGPHHPRVPNLANDVAYWWTTQGHFARALPVLQSVLPHIRDVPMRVATLGDLGRAAGGVGDREAFREAWDGAMELVASPECGHTAPRAWLDLAQGAISLGLWERAEEAARQALEGATRRSDGKTRITAEALLDAARRHHHARDLTPATPAVLEPTASDALAEEFVSCLAVV
jgi:tetratricopeptide (TPR) repeat protein